MKVVLVVDLDLALMVKMLSLTDDGFVFACILAVALSVF